MTWLDLALLLGVSFRLTRLVGWDDLTHPLRVLVTGIGDAEHHELAVYVDRQVSEGGDPWSLPSDEQPPIGRGRFYLSKMLRCPWCVGFWISLAVAAVAAAGNVVSWGWMPALAFTLSAGVGFLAKHLDP